MTLLTHFRGPAVAIIAVIFSATVVLAGQPSGNQSTGSTTAASHAGQSADESAEPSDSPDPSEAADPSDSPEPSDSPDASDAADTGVSSDSTTQCTVDLTQDPTVLAGLNHGSVVCTAAQMPTPTDYANHGAWVSHWAKMNHGHGDHGHGASSGKHQ